MPRGKSKKYVCFLCGRGCVNLCQNCKSVAFCSREHYLAHHQRKYCFPFQFFTDSTLGTKTLIATRDIKPLELIFFEWNLVLGPNWSLNPIGNPSCLDCCKPVENSYKCGHCGLPVCNETCQIGSNHQLECQLWRTKPDLISSLWSESVELVTLAIMPTRLIQAKKFNPKVDNRTRYLYENRTLAEGSKSWNDIKAALTVLMREFVDSNEISEVDMTATLDLVRTCSLITTEDRERALFPIFSQFSHSCISNCKFVVYPNKTLAVLSKTIIKAGDELTISLVPALEPTWKRRAKLYRDHLIECSCRRCRDPRELGTYLSALICQRCSIPATHTTGTEVDEVGCILPINPLEHDTKWACPMHPQRELSNEQAQRLAIDLQRKLYAGGQITTIERLEEVIETFSRILHPNHALLMMVKRSLLNCYSQVPISTVGRKELQRMKELGKEQLTLLIKIDPGYPDWRGDVLRNYSTAELNLAKLDFEDKHITRPEFLLRVKKAMIFVQEGLQCTSCVRVDRSAHTQMSMDILGEEMSADSSYLSDASCSSTCFD
eukprot:TCALIF_09550-PA protein Name:"Similar to msta Protein msta, isoform B (Drosophila melanogaster)" AED:0.04 eAED:0.05 QI:0/1/0/1/1/1/2/0/547